jgi:hypothetical protein
MLKPSTNIPNSTISTKTGLSYAGLPASLVEKYTEPSGTVQKWPASQVNLPADAPALQPAIIGHLGSLNPQPAPAISTTVRGPKSAADSMDAGTKSAKNYVPFAQVIERSSTPLPGTTKVNDGANYGVPGTGFHERPIRSGGYYVDEKGNKIPK